MIAGGRRETFCRNRTRLTIPIASTILQQTGEETNGFFSCPFFVEEKPAYKMLRRLIREEWTTDATVKVTNGEACFRGFYGDYDVIVHADGKSIPASFKLSKNRQNISELVIE